MSNGKRSILVKVMAGVLAGLMVFSMCLTVIVYLIHR